MDRTIRAGGWTEQTETSSQFACLDSSCTISFVSVSELCLHIKHMHLNVDLAAAASIPKSRETETLLRERNGKLGTYVQWRISCTIQRETEALRGRCSRRGRRQNGAVAVWSARCHAEESTDGSRTRAGSQRGRPEVAHGRAGRAAGGVRQEPRGGDVLHSAHEKRPRGQGRNGRCRAEIRTRIGEARAISAHARQPSHSHLHAMLAGIEVAGRRLAGGRRFGERCAQYPPIPPAPLHFPFCAASPRFFGPVFFPLPFCLREALVLSWVGPQSEFLTSCSTWCPCLRRRVPHRGRHGRVKLWTDVLNVPYHCKTK